MTIRPNDNERWEELNALVDGELDPSRVARVAAWIADDRDAARAFAAVASLKATTAGLASVRRTGELSRGSHNRGKVAAALLLAAGLGAAAVVTLQNFTARTVEVTALSPRSLGLSDDVSIGNVRLPNLEAGGLRLERAAMVQDGARPQLEATYVGERGCRVRLVVARAADMDSAGPPAAQAMQWNVGTFVYTLTGDRMDPQRFAAVVQIARADTARTRVAAAPELRNRPCLG